MKPISIPEAVMQVLLRKGLPQPKASSHFGYVILRM